jgi:MATE family multidrug resistance protein
VVISINSVSFMPAFGLASSGAILAGAAIGRGDHAAVWPNVRLTLIATGTWMVGIGALYFIAPRTVLGWFAPADQAAAMIDIGAPMLLVSAAWQAFDAVGLTLMETLRAAGDTTWTAGARLLLAWAVFVPAGLIAVKVLGGGAVSALLCLVLYLALLAVALAWRYRSGAWRKIQLIEPELV